MLGLLFLIELPLLVNLQNGRIYETIEVSVQPDSIFNMTCSDVLSVHLPTKSYEIIIFSENEGLLPLTDEARLFQTEFYLRSRLAYKRKLDEMFKNRYPHSSYEISFYFKETLNGTIVYCDGDTVNIQLLSAKGVISLKYNILHK